MKISRRKGSSKEGQTNLSDFRSGQSEFLGQVKVYSSTGVVMKILKKMFLT